ncbi:MAG: TIGR03667 family PPOX class F420-dependent oxidoreductase [Thermomicrobiales bacterium]|nr:TIGR03667 family PPOX class F420-dependent oxidoreductase [Thermomicrobiales bacterium]
MIAIDTSTEFGARVQQHLDNDLIIWLVTVDGKGTPQPSPVWFQWHEEKVLIFSQPNTAKLRNIERQPRVALHFDSADNGDKVVIMTGLATIDTSLPRAIDLPPYLDKYGEGIVSLGMTNQSFSDEYNVPVLVDPLTLRGF